MQILVLLGTVSNGIGTSAEIGEILPLCRHEVCLLSRDGLATLFWNVSISDLVSFYRRFPVLRHNLQRCFFTPSTRKIHLLSSICVYVQGGLNMAVFWYALTSSNINRFSKLFHCQNHEKMYNNIITKDPTTPQVCRYTTL